MNNIRMICTITGGFISAMTCTSLSQAPGQICRPKRAAFHSRGSRLVKGPGLLLLFFLCFVGIAGADSQIASVQQSLKSEGLYHGAITGEIDNETAAAITRFQVRRGLEVTGELTEETLRALGVNLSQSAREDPDRRAPPKSEPWRALRQQDREFLERLTSEQPTQPGQQVLETASMDQIRDFVAGFVVVGINPDVEAELQFYAGEADYYDSGIVTKDFIRRDILRYNQKWPIRRYWLVGDVQVLNGLEANPVEVQYRIRYLVENRQKKSSGTAIKTLKLQKSPDGLEIISVREKTID
jgi:hypothetical protein